MIIDLDLWKLSCSIKPKEPNIAYISQMNHITFSVLISIRILESQGESKVRKSKIKVSELQVNINPL